ncbi:hypothetical protein MLD38_014735 [Melastoma candidum]|nr:hypothetical protein MLD38_014735 [Melastoma candidum]
MLAAASLVPTILIRSPPAPLGVALLAVSSLSLLSGFIGLYSRLTRFSFKTHVWTILASLTGQVLGAVVLFSWEETSLSLMRSPRDPREAKLLTRLECGVLMVMALVQTGVLVLTCAVHSCWVREYEGFEAERNATAMRRSMKMSSKVCHEVTAGGDNEMKSKDLDAFN